MYDEAIVTDFSIKLFLNQGGNCKLRKGSIVLTDAGQTKSLLML